MQWINWSFFEIRCTNIPAELHIHAIENPRIRKPSCTFLGDSEQNLSTGAITTSIANSAACPLLSNRTKAEWGTSELRSANIEGSGNNMTRIFSDIVTDFIENKASSMISDIY